MARLIVGSLVTVAVFAGFGVAALGTVPGSGSVDTVRDATLWAPGVKTPTPGQIRTPVMADGIPYEVIGIKPGEARAVPVAR